MKRFLKSITVLLFIFTSCLLIGCEGVEFIKDNDNDTNINNNDEKDSLDAGNVEIEDGVNQKLSFESDDDVISFGVLSTASVFSNSGYTKLSANKTASVRKLNTTEETEELDMDLINEYYQMFSSIVNSNPITITAEESDREEYENKLVYTIKDLAGNETSYTIYFNLVLIEELEEVEKDEFDNFDDFEGHDKFDKMHDHLKEHFGHGKWSQDELPEGFVPEDESVELPEGFVPEDENGEQPEIEEPSDEDGESVDLQRRNKGHGGKGHYHKFDQDEDVEYAIEGVAVVNDVEYEIVGSKEQDSENAEEFELELMIKFDEQNFVILEQEVEEGKEEYQYTVVENGKNKYEFELELGQEKLELEIEVLEETEEGKAEKVKYSFKRKTINDTEFVVIKRITKGEGIEILVKASVDEETGEITYEYKLKEKEFHYHKGGKNNK